MSKLTAEKISGNLYQVYRWKDGIRKKSGIVRAVSGDVARLITASRVDFLRKKAKLKNSDISEEEVNEMEAVIKCQEEGLFGPVST